MELVNYCGLSGGKDSTRVLLWLIHESGESPDTMRFTFCDTGNENEFVYRHIAMLSDYVVRHGCKPVVSLHPERDFMQLARWKGRFPSRKARFCTQFLKVIPTREDVQAFLRSDHEVVVHSGVLSKVRYSDDDFTCRRIYTAWDNLKDGKRLFFGLRALRRWIKPDDIMVYMLIGYWPGETHADREIRRWKLRNFGCRPYPMPFVRTPELIGFQRWVVRRADLKMSWEEFMGADFRPERVTRPEFPLLECLQS